MWAKKQQMSGWLALIGMPVVLATAVVSAQNQEPFRATTDFVSTDVIVRQDGKFVPGLNESEFRVYEDDVRQTILLFEPRVGGRSLGNLAEASPSRPAAAREGLILPSARPAADASGRLFVIFIDDLHFPAAATPQVKDLLMRIRDTLIHDNDLVGFVSSGHSSIAIDPAYDFEHRRFNEAIEKTMGGAMSANEIIEGATMETSQGPTGIRYNAHVAFKTAHDLIDQMSAISDRRKVFIYVSNGYNFNPLSDARYQRIQEDYATQDSVSGVDPEDDSEEARDAAQERDTLRQEAYNKRTQFSFSDLTNELAQLGRAAQRANVTFYPIDPRGLIAGGDLDTRAQVGYADWRDYFQTQISSLKLLADETGGFCLCETNDLEGGLRRIDAETSDFYRIGYTSNNPDPLKIRRTIRIEVTRPGVGELIYRREYTLPRGRD
jgi:VWFA-related protein